MSESDNIKSYSASDIQKYLRGELSQADMHAMEKAALDDPFLTDAIEGMEMTMNEYGDEVIGSNLSELNAAIEQKATGARVVAMRPSAWWVAAAAIVIIFSGVFVYKNYTSNTALQSTIAKGENAKPPAQPTIGPSDESVSGSASTTPSDSFKLIELNNNGIASNKDDKFKSNSDGITSHLLTDKKTMIEPKPLRDSAYSFSRSFSATETRQLSLPPVQLNFDTLKDKLEGKAAGAVTVTVDDRYAYNKQSKKDSETMDKGLLGVSKPQARSKQEETIGNQNWSNNFRGRVLDNNNQPIANAVVSIEKEKNAVTTDREGNFLINSRDSQPNANVSGVGFEPKKVELSNNVASNQINLDSNKYSLDEVVVTGYGTKRKAKQSSVELSTKVQAAVPVIGWVEYEKYLEKNKKIDGDIKYNAGEVVVSFIVDKKGKLSSFKIEQSLGKSEDAEALRLIKEGPAWKPTQDKKSRVTVIIRF